MRGAQLARQWKILKLLETRKPGLSVTDISGELDVPSRTVYRDLEALQAAGFPLHAHHEDNRSYWRLLEGFRTDLPVPLSTTELMSLHMSRDLFRVFHGTVFQESVESLFAKVRASLSHEAVEFLANASSSLSIGFGPPKDFQSFNEVLTQASEAAAQRKRVEITYEALSTRTLTNRTVDPYKVWFMNGCFYLIGLCHIRDAVRTFAMDRIKEFSILGESFDMPSEFSLEEYLQTAFRVMTGKPEVVKVWFRSSAAQVVKERIWHPSQEIREQEDGSVVVTLEVPINYEIVSWILGFGSAAKVLDPPSLKERIVRELDGARARYGAGDGSEKKG